MKQRSPTATAEKGFMFGSGKINLEVNLDREVWYHGEEIPVHISINNQSKKAIKNIRCHVNQHCELSMVNAQYSCKVARLDTQDGCPLQSGSNLNRTITLKPLAQNCYGIRGLCLDAALSKVTDESNLASSSLADTGNQHDLLGVVVSYSVKIKLILSGMGGELETDLPFKLVHPRPSKKIFQAELIRKYFISRLRRSFSPGRGEEEREEQDRGEEEEVPDSRQCSQRVSGGKPGRV